MFASLDPTLPLVIIAAGTFLTVIFGFILSLMTHKKVKQVDNAVNGKPPGAATIAEEVKDIHDAAVPVKVPPIQNGGVLVMLARLEEKMDGLMLKEGKG